MKAREQTDWHCLLWYDGPHIEIRGVREVAGEPRAHVVEVRTWAAEVEPIDSHGCTKVTVRLTRADLEAALGLLDGKPTTDEPNHEDPVPTWREAP